MIKKLRWILRCIMVPTEYLAAQDGSLMVREWFNKPVDLYAHLKIFHGLSDAEINDIVLAVQSGKKLSHAGDMDDQWDP